MQGIRHLTFTYQRKEGTATSYYLVSGEPEYLPKRICITRQEFAPISGMPKIKAGQLKATFTRSENSIYKNGKGSIHSTIYAPIKPFPTIIGTGDLQGTRDLLVFQSLDEWQNINVHLFINGLFSDSQLINELMKKPLP